jgi:hypothetical protein
MTLQYEERICVCGEPENKHAKSEPRVCNSLASGCWGFQPKLDFPYDYEKYLNEIPETKEKIRWLLENIAPLRNEANQLFDIDYLIFTIGSKDQIIFHLLKSLRSRIRYLTLQKKLIIEDWETIRRAKQLLVDKEGKGTGNYAKYGPYDPKVEQEKEMKQTAFEEYLSIGVS